MLLQLRKYVDRDPRGDLTKQMTAWSNMGNIFALKVVMELHEHSAVDLAPLFCEGLTTAVAAGKMRAIKLLVATGQDVNRLSSGLWEGSLVAIAAAHGYRDVVELLVEKYGANMNGVGSYPLHAALRGQQPWRYLLDLGADVNHKRENKTPLMDVIHFAPDRVSEIDELAGTAGVDINEGDDMYESPLDAATEAGHGDAATVLLDHGADVHKGSPLPNAMWADLWELVELLLDRGANAYGTLHPLFNTNDPDYIKKTLPRLLAAGDDIDQIILGSPLICWPSEEARICDCKDDHYSELWYRNLESLLRNGVDVDNVDSNGDSALRIACGLDNDHRPILIEALLRYHIDVNIPNKRRETALMSRYLTDADVEELIIHNATINAVDLNGGSALHLAFKWQVNPAMVEALLRNGLDPTIRDRWGHTARYYMESVNEMALEKSSNPRFEILTLFRRWGVEHNLVWDRDCDAFMERTQSTDCLDSLYQ